MASKCHWTRTFARRTTNKGQARKQKQCKGNQTNDTTKGEKEHSGVREREEREGRRREDGEEDGRKENEKGTMEKGEKGRK